MSSSSESDYEDTVENTVDLESSLRYMDLAMDYFLNDNIEKARAIFLRNSATSLYHSLGVNMLDFLNAMLTQEKEKIKNTSKTLKHTLKFCENVRKKKAYSTVIVDMFVTSTDTKYTPEQLHAELCLAEIYLFQSILLIFEDETLSALIKSCIKMKNCYNIYKKCSEIFDNYTFDNKIIKDNFECGFRIGLGAFNLILSSLPKKVIRLLEWIGFSADADVGISYLDKSTKLHNCCRRHVASIMLLEYYLVFGYFKTCTESDLKYCEDLLSINLQKYPKSALYLRYKARLESMKGNMIEAEVIYKSTISTALLWVPIHAACYWELMFVSCCVGDYNRAIFYADNLLATSNWSKSGVYYLKCCFMIGSSTDRHEVSKLMRLIPENKRKYAGKSIPLEKFAVSKAEKYFQQKETLYLPDIEFLFILGFFKSISRNQQLFNLIFTKIENQLKQININDVENKCLLLLLKGACLRHLNMFLQAEVCLNEVIQSEHHIVYDKYIVPWALAELAFIELEKLNTIQATKYFDSILKNYSKYALETRLHFKIELAKTDIAKAEKRL